MVTAFSYGVVVSDESQLDRFTSNSPGVFYCPDYPDSK